VLTHGKIILGPEVDELESKVADYCGRKYAVGVSSGTDALYVALRTLDIGVGDEVITTPMSWVATLNAIVVSGATPVFVDIGPDLNINAELLSEAITEKTKAIVPVHYTGHICDMDRIAAVADRKGIPIIEDAAQAFGASLPDGRRAGSMGKVACLSMNSMKVFHSYGEAGAVLFDDESLRDKAVALRYAGTINREDCHYPSLNFRLQTMQAALLLVELERIEMILQRRNEIAQIYDSALSGILKCPAKVPGSRHAYYTYTVQVDRRDELMAFLGENGIELKIHHPFLMPEQTAYRDKFKPVIPVAQDLVKKILSLPNHEKMTDDEVDYVICKLKEFYQ
jgi:dTDP-4-amino-4,6-dideoxygalactose transaminase